MKRALVLAGGGARGSYQAGMLEELVINQGLDFQIIRGVSVGALNASFLAQASIQGDSLQNLKDKVTELRQLWLNEIEGNHSVYAERAGFAGIALGADSLYSLKPLQTLIDKHLVLKDLRNSGRDFKVGTVSLVSGQYFEWTPKAGRFKSRVLASASIPVIFPFVDLKREEEVLVDGGVRNITPLSSAFAAQPDEIYVFLTSRLMRDGKELPDSGVLKQSYEQWDDGFLGTEVSGLDVLKRSVEILTDEVYLDDIRVAIRWNEVVQRANAVVEEATAARNLPSALAGAIEKLRENLEKPKRRYVPIYVLAPQQWYGDTNDSTQFSPSLIRQAVDHGREIAADQTLWLWPPA